MRVSEVDKIKLTKDCIPKDTAPVRLHEQLCVCAQSNRMKSINRLLRTILFHFGYFYMFYMLVFAEYAILVSMTTGGVM